MIIGIKSQNNKLPDILCRNPETDFGLYLCPLKNGYIAGNVVSQNEYEIVFQDTKYSYLPEDSDSLDYQSYCSPLSVLHICNELFAHILKSRAEFAAKPIKWLGMTQGEADSEPCTIEIPSFYIDSNWLRNDRFLLTKYFKEIEIKRQSYRIFSLKITGKSVFEAFNLLALTALFAHVTNEYALFVYIDDNLTEKFGRILTNIENVPYFVFYLFTARAIRSPKQFTALKPMFEKYLATNGLQAVLVLESTHRLRLLFILGLLETNIPVVDVGCGELLYYKKIMDKGFAADYHAIDKDPEMERIAEMIGRRYSENNLKFYSDVNECVVSGEVNVLLTEVIEHNSLEEAKALMLKVLNYEFNKLIVTTPNVEFNVFYAMNDEFRHYDHQFELTRDEFRSFVDECVENRDLHVEYFYLGDSLNGIQPVQGCIIRRKK